MAKSATPTATSRSPLSYLCRPVYWLLIPIAIAIYLYRPSPMTVSTRQLLPTNVKPTHYNLTLRTDHNTFETFVYHGQVSVALQVKEDTQSIVLHAHDIKIHHAELTSIHDQNEKQKAVNISYDEIKNLATLIFPKSVSADTDAVLDISFEGILNDQMAGFYRSSYKDADGNTQVLATTQFEATDARRAFPCWDEPAIKATFDVTLVVPSALTALSNMNVVSEEPLPEDLKEVKYATTPPMSTYLLAFVIGPFEYIEAYTSGEHNGRPIRARVYALPGSVEQGRHALNVCTAALEYFAKVFDEPYPLPKVDMVAIPDFEAGAMENWGLITYRTVALLYDENLSSIAFKKSTAYTVCHELAHQWFGNLVTMEWWEHLWLNEGFATWVGWLAVDSIFPEFNVWTSFVNDDMPRALNLDALRSSHPIEVAVNDPSEIHQIFDAISYYKGASVIRMLSSWLGVDTFMAGVRRYLHRHKFGNASTNDLWTALSEEAGVDVSQFMVLWTQRVGYPILTVTQSDPHSITVTQSRYLSTGDLTAEEDSTIWWTPLSILTSDKVEPHTLTEKTQTFPISQGSLFKLNAGQTAVYRVNYPIEVIRKLAGELKKGKEGLLANTADRVGLLADAGNLCVSGAQSTTAFLELAQAFTEEDNYFVWSQLSNHLSKILGAWSGQPQSTRDKLKSLRLQLFAPLAHKLGWESHASDDYLTNLLRVLALSNAGRSNDHDIVEEAKSRFWRFVQGNSNALHANLRGPVYGIVLLTAESEEEETKIWKELLEIYRDEKLPMDQRLIALRSLGRTKTPSLIKQYLDMSLDEKDIKAQDVIYVYGSLSSNADAREQLWEFFKTNYDTLHAKFSKSLSLFGATVKAAVSGFSTFEKLEEIEAFFADKHTKEYARPLQQALEAIRVKAKWVQRDQEAVADWLSAHITE